MTLDEFENAHPREAGILASYTGCYSLRNADWIRAGSRMDVVGVYEDDDSWVAHVEHLVGDHLVIEQCRWYADYVRPDQVIDRPSGAWRWLGENGHPCDNQGREEP